MASRKQSLAKHGYLTALGFAEYIKEADTQFVISYPTIIRSLRNGRIQGYQVGGQWRIPEAEIMRFCREGNFKEGAEKPFPLTQDETLRTEEEDEHNYHIGLTPKPIKDAELRKIPNAPKDSGEIPKGMKLSPTHQDIGNAFDDPEVFKESDPNALPGDELLPKKSINNLFDDD